MKKALSIGLVAVAGLACIVIVNGCQPERLTPERVNAARDVELRLAEAEKEHEHMENEHEEHEAEAAGLLEHAPLPEGYSGGKGPQAATLTAPDTFGSLLAAGITAMLALQVLINIGMVTGSLPVTGINLPFISAGGSSVFFNLFSLGILLNISRHCHR